VSKEPAKSSTQKVRTSPDPTEVCRCFAGCEARLDAQYFPQVSTAIRNLIAFFG